MKILIVDDEELTRTGLVSSIDWNSLGIQTVLQADDGLKGLEIAKLHKPDIILCDVRMPRMDGISMLKQLEKVLPDSISIFMSGYSDKEYLKAAIKLHALQYIEKPLNPEDVKAAILEARELYLYKQRMHRGEALHSMETSSKLTLQLTVPYGNNADAISKLMNELSLPISPSTFFTAIIIQLDSSLDSVENETFYHSLKNYLEIQHMHCLYAEKKTQYLVYYIIGNSSISSLFSNSLKDFFKDNFSHLGKYHIAMGSTVSGVSKAYHSYEAAVILLQSSYFYPSGTFLLWDNHIKSNVSISATLPYAPDKDFSGALSAQNKTTSDYILNKLYQTYSNNNQFLPNQVKELYYKLFSTIESLRLQMQITLGHPSAGIVDYLEKSFTFQELHQELCQQTDKFFVDAQNSKQDNSTIFLIKDYIGKNYSDPTLSVKDISAHVFLSTSYVCTFFKNETGQTLNQFLTEYRMEKAKQLLSDSRYKITDISSKVGYTDGNYFGKSFKKYTGLSPSEYREKNL